MKFGVKIIYKKPLGKRDFREDRVSETYFTYGGRKPIPVLGTFRG
jgi:hypothetical protein